MTGTTMSEQQWTPEKRAELRGFFGGAGLYSAPGLTATIEAMHASARPRKIRMIDHGVAINGKPPHVIETDDVEEIIEYLNQVVRPEVKGEHDDEFDVDLNHGIELLRAGDIAGADAALTLLDMELKDGHA